MSQQTTSYAVAESGGSTSQRSDLPLAGVRILDLTMVWAGPFATKQLVDAGAEVIKVEGPGRTDLVRSLTIPDETVDRPWDASRYFHEYNRGKLGIAVDVRQEAGRAVLLELALASDVLIENFRPGVLDRLGLSWELLHERNPRLIVASLPGYSAFVPERGLPGYGPNVEQMGGLAYFNGYAGGPPQKSGISYGDPMAGLGGAAAVMLALMQRERTGVGQRLEAGQRNVLIGLMGDALVAHQLGITIERHGNRSLTVAPQGAYPCQSPDGEPAETSDTWVALSAATDAEWSDLCEVIGRPELSADPRFADVRSRQAAHDELDEIIGAWTRERTGREAADALQARGIAASPVLRAVDIPGDPQLSSRDFLVPVEHPDLGTTKLTTPTWRFDGLKYELTPAPGLGQHNHQVLSQVLGYDDDKIAALQEAGVIADRPAAR